MSARVVLLPARREGETRGGVGLWERGSRRPREGSGQSWDGWSALSMQGPRRQVSRAGGETHSRAPCPPPRTSLRRAHLPPLEYTATDRNWVFGAGVCRFGRRRGVQGGGSVLVQLGRWMPAWPGLPARRSWERQNSQRAAAGTPGIREHGTAEQGEHWLAETGLGLIPPRQRERSCPRSLRLGS